MEAQWPIGCGVGLRIKRSSVRIWPWTLRWVLGQGSLLPLSQGEAFTLASISYLAILVKYILPKKKKRSWLGTMRQTTRSHAYLFRKTIFAPAPQRWALTRFPRSIANLTVLGKKDRRSLEVAAAVPWFWRKDRQSLTTFVSFVYVSMGGMSGKHSADLKTPRRQGQHLRRWNQCQNGRFFQTCAESLEVAFTLRFWEKSKKSNFMILYTKWSG